VAVHAEPLVATTELAAMLGLSSLLLLTFPVKPLVSVHRLASTFAACPGRKAMVNSPDAICLGSDQTVQVGEVAQQTLITGCRSRRVIHVH